MLFAICRTCFLWCFREFPGKGVRSATCLYSIASSRLTAANFSVVSVLEFLPIRLFSFLPSSRRISFERRRLWFRSQELVPCGAIHAELFSFIGVGAATKHTPHTKPDFLPGPRGN